MSPEYGATAALFPIDDETLAYLRQTGRAESAHRRSSRRYAKENGLWREPGAGPDFDETLELDLATDRADSRRPAPAAGQGPAARAAGELPRPPTRRSPSGKPQTLTTNGLGGDTIDHGSVAIAAITSCTNTSNPTVMIGAGLLARNALARGLNGQADRQDEPGARVRAPSPSTTRPPACSSRSRSSASESSATAAPRASATAVHSTSEVAEAIESNDLVVAAVLSGNRNFEGRIHPLARASYLASPPLVVAFALAGTIEIDLLSEPLGTGSDGQPVFLADIWPTPEEIKETIATAVSPDIFRRIYASVFDGDERWRELPVPVGSKRYAWDETSTYVARPPFLDGIGREPAPVSDIEGARVLAVLGDSVTTDHISPAGTIPAWSPAGQWLQEHGVTPLEFNSYGARRGHHEVMMRGTFGNIRLRNALTEKEGPYTTHQPSGDEMFIYDAAIRYAAEDVPLIVICRPRIRQRLLARLGSQGHDAAGRHARCWPRAYERIHRANLVGMGVLPLQFLPGQNAQSLGLTGTRGVRRHRPGQRASRSSKRVKLRVR